MLRNPVCAIRSLWRTLCAGAPVSGCDGREEYSGSADVLVIQCSECGRVHVGWEPLPKLSTAERAELEHYRSVFDLAVKHGDKEIPTFALAPMGTVTDDDVAWARSVVVPDVERTL